MGLVAEITKPDRKKNYVIMENKILTFKKKSSHFECNL